MESQDQTQEQEYRLKPKMPGSEDQSPPARLARAIEAKDANQVRELVKTVKLTGKYLGSFWSHRVVDHFDPEVAAVMEQAKMRLNYPRQLLQIAQHNDDPEAYLWLFEHKSLNKFFAQEQTQGTRRYGLSCQPWYENNSWQIPVYQRDKSFVDPFFLYQGSPRIMTTLLSHPRAEFYKHAIARQFTFANMVRARNWDGFDLLLTKMASWFGPDKTCARLSNAIGLYAGYEGADRFIELEEQMKTRKNANLFSSIFPLTVQCDYTTKGWEKATQQSVEGVRVDSVSQVCLVKTNPIILELIKNPEHEQWYKDRLVSKDGVALMSQLAYSSFKTVVSHVIDRLLPAMEQWEQSEHNPNGYTPAQVMLLASKKVALAEYFLVNKPEWATRQVGVLPPALDMVDMGSVDQRKVNSKARLRKKALEIKSKSIRGAVPSSPATAPKPKVFM